MARTNSELSASELIMIGTLEGIANNSVIYKNNSGTYTALSLGSTGNVLMSGGITSAPTFSSAGNITLFGLPLTGAKYVGVYGQGLATGDNDLYTCPAGKKAYLHPVVQAFNPTVGSITYYSQLKISGVYYRLAATTSLATNTAGISAGPQGGILINAGESISINVATTSGLNIGFRVIEFDNTNLISRKSILNLVSGNNTIFTVTAGKTAYIVGNLENGSSNPLVSLCNGSVNTQTYDAYQVPNGSSPGTTNKIAATTTRNTLTASGFAVAGTLSAGDSIIINASSSYAGQIVWATIIEV